MSFFFDQDVVLIIDSDIAKLAFSKKSLLQYCNMILNSKLQFF